MYCGESLPSMYEGLPVVEYRNQLIIPGFVDTHAHAPQYCNRGLGMDKELLPWLETYTFPEESKFKDTEYARLVYSAFVRDLWRHGTTRSILFGTIHKDSTLVLMELLQQAGLSALVGKVNMDRNSPDFLIEDTTQSLADTKAWLEASKVFGPLVKPVITPRFVPSCTSELMRGLGELAKEYDVPVQSHLSENHGEIEWVSALHPESGSYTDVYYEHQLMGQTPTVMAHCIHLSEAFYLATKGGGTFFGKVGSFEVGYELDALVIDDTSMFDANERSLEERLERWIYIGDDRHIMKRYVAGRLLEEPK